MLKTLFITLALLATGFVHAEDRWMSIPPAVQMPDAAESGSASVNGIEMYYAIYGDAAGIPVLMVHGGLAHADIWSGLIAELAADYKVIVADTRGHGRSTNDGSAYSYDLLTQDYVALLDHLKVEKVHLVGWSDGSNIGYTMSTSAPTRIASHFAHAGNVTLAGINPEAETSEVFGAYVGMMMGDYSTMSSTPAQFEPFLNDIITMWSTEKLGGMEALAKIDVPTLVVQSQYDEAILPAHSKEMAEAIPNGALLTLENVSHFATFQAPAEYVVAIKAFLKQQGG